MQKAPFSLCVLKRATSFMEMMRRLLRQSPVGRRAASYVAGGGIVGSGAMTQQTFSV